MNRRCIPNNVFVNGKLWTRKPCVFTVKNKSNVLLFMVPLRTLRTKRFFRFSTVSLTLIQFSTIYETTDRTFQLSVFLLVYSRRCTSKYTSSERVQHFLKYFLAKCYYIYPHSSHKNECMKLYFFTFTYLFIHSLICSFIHKNKKLAGRERINRRQIVLLRAVY